MFSTINLYLGGKAMPSLSMLKTSLILSLFSAVQTVWLSTEKIKIKKGSKMGLGNVDAFSVSDGLPKTASELPRLLDNSPKEPPKKGSFSRCVYLLRYLSETLERKAATLINSQVCLGGLVLSKQYQEHMD